MTLYSPELCVVRCMRLVHDGLGTISMEQPAIHRESSFIAVIMDRDVSSEDGHRPLMVICCNPGVPGFLYVLMGKSQRCQQHLHVSLTLGTDVLLSMLVAGVTRLTLPTV